MAKSFWNYKPIKQLFGMSCWAACLEWWSVYMSPAKPIMTQLGLIYEARSKGASPLVEPLHADYGGMEIQHIKPFLERSDLCAMKADRVPCFSLTTEDLKQKLTKGPVFVSYFEPKVGGAHANIIINCKTHANGVTKVRVMEPRIGYYQKRDWLDFCNRGDIIIGWQN